LGPEQDCKEFTAGYSLHMTVRPANAPFAGCCGNYAHHKQHTDYHPRQHKGEEQTKVIHNSNSSRKFPGKKRLRLSL